MAGQERAGMVDVVFALTGDTLPHEHRNALAAALSLRLPWLADEPRAGIHRLNLVAGSDGEDIVSQRTRLVLRLPRESSPAAFALAGTDLDVAGHRLRLGPAHRRELLPHGTVYAHLVATGAANEALFLQQVGAELAAMEVRCWPICGRWQSAEAPVVTGCSLMLDGLRPEHALRVMERGLGRHRQLGCGVFVPHRSAAPVGAA